MLLGFDDFEGCLILMILKMMLGFDDFGEDAGF